MEKNIIMNRSIWEKIPIWEWNDLKLIRLGKGTFFTVKPVKKGVRSLGEAKTIARHFTQKHGCQATVTYDTEWEEVCNFLKVNFSTKDFVEINKLEEDEALLLDSEVNGDRHILAGGENRSIGELFHNFISGDDADGEPQPRKLLFLTLRFNPDDIVVKTEKAKKAEESEKVQK